MLKGKVNKSTSVFERLNKSTNMLNDVLSIRQSNMHGLGFADEYDVKQQPLMFVKEGTDMKLEQKSESKKKKVRLSLLQ